MKRPDLNDYLNDNVVAVIDVLWVTLCDRGADAHYLTASTGTVCYQMTDFGFFFEILN